MSVIRNSIYRLNTIFIQKFHQLLFGDYIEKIILKFIWKGRINTIAKIILKRKNKVEGIVPNFKTIQP